MSNWEAGRQWAVRTQGGKRVTAEQHPKAVQEKGKEPLGGGEDVTPVHSGREGRRGSCTLSAKAPTLSDLCSTEHRLRRNTSQFCWLDKEVRRGACTGHTRSCKTFYLALHHRPLPPHPPQTSCAPIHLTCWLRSLE